PEYSYPTSRPSQGYAAACSPFELCAPTRVRGASTGALAPKDGATNAGGLPGSNLNFSRTESRVLAKVRSFLALLGREGSGTRPSECNLDHSFYADRTLQGEDPMGNFDKQRHGNGKRRTTR